MDLAKKAVVFFHALLTKVFNLAGESTHLKVRIGAVQNEDVDYFIQATCVKTNATVKLAVHFDNAFDYVECANDVMIQAVLNYALRLGYRVKKLHWGDETIQFRHYPEIVLYDRLRINRFRLPETIDVIRTARIRTSKSAAQALQDESGSKVLIKNTGTKFDGEVFELPPVVTGEKVGLGSLPQLNH